MIVGIGVLDGGATVAVGCAVAVAGCVVTVALATNDNVDGVRRSGFSTTGVAKKLQPADSIHSNAGQMNKMVSRCVIPLSPI